jgi:hypothetical protein
MMFDMMIMLAGRTRCNPFGQRSRDAKSTRPKTADLLTLDDRRRASTGHAEQGFGIRHFG